MNDESFDALAKELAGTGTRRSLLRTLGRSAFLAVAVGGPIGTTLRSRSSGAATCRAGGEICREHANCCSGTCGPKDSVGRRRCTCGANLTACGTQCCSAGQICLNGSCRQPTPTATTTPAPPIVCGDTTCATGEACADGRCFLTNPNCAGCSNCWAPTITGGDARFCTPCDDICAGQDCTTTSQCGAGEFCASVRCVNDELFNKCVAGCRA